jgi:hypothetical protein
MDFLGLIRVSEGDLMIMSSDGARKYQVVLSNGSIFGEFLWADSVIHSRGNDRFAVDEIEVWRDGPYHCRFDN